MMEEKTRGRLRKTWEVWVKQTANRRGVDWQDADRMAQDKNKWREFWRSIQRIKPNTQH